MGSAILLPQSGYLVRYGWRATRIGRHGLHLVPLLPAVERKRSALVPRPQAYNSPASRQSLGAGFICRGSCASRIGVESDHRPPVSGNALYLFFGMPLRSSTSPFEHFPSASQLENASSACLQAPLGRSSGNWLRGRPGTARRCRIVNHRLYLQALDGREMG
jgi:hypothetical protein